jgi:hypothetical protein
MKNLVKDASMGPLREALQTGVEIAKLSKEDMRPVMLKVFAHEIRISGHLNLIKKKKKFYWLKGSLLMLSIFYEDCYAY